MIIAKDNQGYLNYIADLPAIISGGGGITGDGVNVYAPDFSLNITTLTDAALNINVGSQSNVQYFAIHGLYSNSKSDLTITLLDNGTPIGDATLKYWQSSCVFYIGNVTSTSLNVNISGSGIKTVTYIAFGSCTIVPNGGVTGGQVYPYLQNNYKAANVFNSDASPTSQRVKRVAPTVTLSFPNILFSTAFLSGELQEVYELSNAVGPVSMLDFHEGDNYDPTRSWVGFGLEPTTVTADSRYNQLNSISMKFKAAF
jgi:hypothetical protein